MPTPDHYPLNCGAITENAFDDWQKLGLGIQPPEGAPIYWHDRDQQLWKQIGAVTVHDNGSIHLWPYEGLHETEINELRAAGMEAYRNTPTRHTHWTHNRDDDGDYWESFFSVSVDEEDGVARQIRAAADRRHRHSATARMARISAA